MPIVVGADAAAQSDLYSAVTLAGVIDTSCIVLAGPRDGEMPAEQIARLDAASAGGWVMGGEAAVPEAKVAGRGLKRLNGVDRWHTARLAGAIALDPDGDVAALTAATAPGDGELGGGSVTVDGAEVRLPPGLDASCDGQVPIVVAADAAAQSDLYSAATLAGVLDTTCIVLAGARGEPMSTDEFARLAAADSEGWIVGGVAAVPAAKVAAFTLTRIGGADRWATARLIGETAVAQAAREPAGTTTTTTEARSSSGGGSAGSSGGGSARSSGGGSSRRVSSGGGGGISRPPAGPSAGPSAGTPTGGTPAGGSPTGTTTTTMPGDTTTTTEPELSTTTTTTTEPEPTTTTTTEPPQMASTFTPTISLAVPQLAGTTGDNIWATSEFEVTLARAAGADDGCSLMSRQTVTFTVQPDGSVTDDGNVPTDLVGTTATGVACSYTVTFPAAPTDTPGGDFDWAMSPAAATTATLRDATTADNSATATYTVGAVTFVPDATITVPSGSDGAAFDVDFASTQANCSGVGGAPQTLTYAVPAGGTTAQPVTTNPPLIGYPAGATATTDVCAYTVTFPTNENGAAVTLVLDTLNAPPDATATGTDQAIAATYVPALKGVSSGETFSCALASEGAAFCWGDNNHGQLIAPDGPFTQVSTGIAHACGLKTDGSAACWGDDTYGQATVPDLAPGVTLTALDAGWQYTCGLTSNGTIECWGRNQVGQATAPDPAAGETFTQVSAGGLHSCAVKSDQSVVCWGEDTASQLASQTPTGSFLSVSAGSFYACGVRSGGASDGSVACWGTNLEGRTTVPAGSFTSVSAGLLHACGVRSGGASDGAVTCWGTNDEHQSTVPSAAFAAVSAGRFHSCGLKIDGSVACWGYGNFGQADAPAGTFAAVSAGRHHTCGIRGDTTRCWGANDTQLAVPTLGAGESFTQLSAGTSHTCGVRSGGASDGSVACWGEDGPAGFEDGRVSMAPAGAFAAVAAGGGHSCGIRSGGASAGQIECWGRDTFNQATPPDLGPGETFTAVGAGGHHTCALKSDMSVACWGYDGAFPPDGRVSETPSEAIDLFSSLAVGSEHTCAVRASDGSVACWGSDVAGQSTPPAGAFSAVAAGNEHTCGIRSGDTAGGAADGTVVCWGSNNAGQADPPEGTFAALTAGRFHTCGIRSGDTAGSATGGVDGAPGGTAAGAASDNVVCWGAGTAWGTITARPTS